jgi:hypothetical protein
MGGNRHALDQLKGIAFHHHAVGKGAGIASSALQTTYLRVAGALATVFHLIPPESPPAAPAQARLGHFGDHRRAAHARAPGQGRPAAGGGVIVQAQRARLAGAGKVKRCWLA